jgi:hypothetical protein
VKGVKGLDQLKESTRPRFRHLTGANVPTRAALSHHSGADVVDNVLAAIFGGRLTGTVISLLPLRFQPGGRIISLHSGACAGAFINGLTGLMGGLLWPHRRRHPGTAPLTTSVGLFVHSVEARWPFGDSLSVARHAPRPVVLLLMQAVRLCPPPSREQLRG